MLSSHGGPVWTYSTLSSSGKEWKWTLPGMQQKKPSSFSIQGPCKKVEVYDEDGNGQGYLDNLICTDLDTRSRPFCYDLPWDLYGDVGGLKVWADTLDTSAPTVTTLTTTTPQRRNICLTGDARVHRTTRMRSVDVDHELIYTSASQKSPVCLTEVVIAYLSANFFIGAQGMMF